MVLMTMPPHRVFFSAWVSLFLVLAAWGTFAWAETPIPWKEETFSKSVFEEDVRVILTELLHRNGQEVAFKPDVSGDVTLELSNVSLRTAFTRIMEESSLGHTYAQDTNMVTIFPQNPKEMTEDVFIPKHSTLDEILPTLEHFNYDASGLTFTPDEETHAIYLKGPQKKVTSLMKVLEKVDDALKNRRIREVSDRENRLKLASMDREMENTRIEIKVIPLRFANVGKQKVSFQGESITLPGIIDSLDAFMGTLDKHREGRGEPGSVMGLAPPPVVSSDQRTNSVIIQGTPQQIQRISEIVASLDQPVPLVEIEVLIVDGQAEVLREIGVQFGMRGNVGKNAAGQPVQDYDTATNTATEIAAPASGSGAFSLGSRPDSEASNTTLGFIFSGAREVIDANLELLASENRLHTVASPRVITMNHQTAKITNAKNVNFVVTTGDGSQSDIKTVNSGIVLDITPSVIEPKVIGDKRLLRLKIDIKNSSISSQTGDSVNTDEQEMQTNVILPEGATFVTGGLFNTRREEVETGVPGLKELPLLGNLFRYRMSEDRKSETIFLITPKVYRNEDIMRVQDHETPRYMSGQRQRMRESNTAIRQESQLIPLKRTLSEEE